MAYPELLFDTVSKNMMIAVRARISKVHLETMTQS
jgi:hypothetical protein